MIASLRTVRLAAVLLSSGALGLGPVVAAAQSYVAPIASAGAYGRLAGAPVRGQDPAPRPGVQTVNVDLSGPEAPVRTLALPRGKSAVIDLPTDAQDVLVSDPKVAEVVVTTRRHITVLGMGAGQTDASFTDASGRQILRLNIRVDQDVSALGDTLNRLLPGSSIRVEPVNDSIVLTGEVENASAASKAVRLASAFVSKPEQIVNMLAVSESEQVMLKVRVVEVNRSVIKQLGVNLNALIGQLGGAQFAFANAASWGVNGALLGGLTGGYALDTTQQATPAITNSSTSALGYTTNVVTNPVTGMPVFNANGTVQTYQAPINSMTNTTTNSGLTGSQALVTSGHAGSAGLNQAGSTINAFERAGLVRSLAEPDLTVVSGESGHYLVGGEFPVPVGEDNNGRVTIEFKQYGIGLGYTPVVLSKGRISLKLSAEVSELTSTGGFTLGNSSASTAAPSLVVPGLNVRRVETSVELPSGQSLMIAGLLQSNAKQTIDSLPGVMNLPILGALFNSRDYLNNETELVVIITPYLVKPVAPNQLQTPADGLQVASDVETTLMGRLNKSFGKPAAPPKGTAYQGPVGYVVD